MQASGSQTNSDEPCDICGDVGFQTFIATCIKCKKAREHAYCMRSNALESLEDWICESCLSGHIVLHEARKPRMRTMTLGSNVVCRHGMHSAKPSLGLPSYFGRQKTVEARQVKLIPTKEAIKLSSRATKRGRNPAALHSMSSVSPRTAPLKGTFLRVKENPKVGPSGPMGPPGHGGV